MKKTKIALIAPGDTPTEGKNIWNFTSMMSYNIIKELEKRDDIEIVQRVKSQNENNLHKNDWNGATHIFGAILRFWSWVDPNITAQVKRQVPGKLFQFYDTGRRPERTDVNFAVMDFALNQKDVHVGWAADPDVFHIDKSREDDTLRILIDHPHYGTAKPSHEMTDEISALCYHFSKDQNLLQRINEKQGTSFKNVVCRRMVSGGIEEVDISKKINGDFNKSCVSQEELAKEYAKAHIFFTTHLESLGMCVLEAAMSGCYIVSPKNFVKDAVLKHVNHSKFNTSIDWNHVISGINPVENRKKVEHWTWERCVDIMVKSFHDHDPT